MKISPTHWLDVAKRLPITGGDPMLIRRCLVLHHTNGGHAKNTIAYMKSAGKSVHLVIDRDGTIYQCRPFNRTCGHAGISRWRDPKTGKLYKNINSCSIGIELCNAGDVDAVRKQYSKLPPRKLKGWDGTRARNWEDFPSVQVNVLRQVSIALVQHYNLDDVTGHYWIAPDRRDDPGPTLDMRMIRDVCGFGKTLPKIA